MLKSFQYSKNSIYYYDLEEKTIARFPTKSNLLTKGSDNSLYFGMVTNLGSSENFCNFFNVKSIDLINGETFDFNFEGEKIKIEININAQGQIQIKLLKDGLLSRVSATYAYTYMKNFDFTKMLVVLDFKKNEIRFKDYKDLIL